MGAFRFLLILAVIAFLAACVGDDAYRIEPLQKRALGGKTSWRQETAAFSQKAATGRSWWQEFNDPMLTRLIRDVETANLDLRIATHRIRSAGITLREEKAGQWPTASFTGNFSWSRHRNEIEAADDIEAVSSGVVPVVEYETDLVTDEYKYINLGINVSWELDLWGRKQRAYRATLADYAASQANRIAARLKVISEVALAYIELRQRDRDIRIVVEQIEDHRERLDILEDQYEAGIVPQWRLLRQLAELNTAAGELTDIKGARRQLEHRIATLLGQPAGAVAVPDTGDRNPLSPIGIPAGLPSDLLARRPDIIAAAHRVESAYQRVGEARAARLPTLSLSGNGGLASNSLSNLLEQWTLGLAPNLLMPIFDAGARKARVETNEIRLEIAEDEYRRVVLQGLEEVENLLTRRHTARRQYEILEKRIDLLKQVRNQTHARFREGLLSQLEVLDMDRELFGARRALNGVRRRLMDNTIALWKSLGGGWRPGNGNGDLSACQ